MRDRTKDVIVLIFGLVLEALVFIKEKFNGGKNNDSSGSGKKK